MQIEIFEMELSSPIYFLPNLPNPINGIKYPNFSF